MPFLIGIRKSSWYPPEDASWIPEGDIPADAVSNLRVSNNCLSIWLIDTDRTNLPKVVAALAATRKFLSNFDYALFDERLVEGLAVHETAGTTPYLAINSYHRDLVQLTGGRLLKLAQGIYACREKGRFSEKEVRSMIASALKANEIPENKIEESLRRSILA